MSSRPTLLIPCEGRGTRWRNHLGIPKTLIRLDGETLTQRTVRLFRERVPTILPLLIGTDPRLAFQGVRLVPPDPNSVDCDLDKLLCGWSHWNPIARTWIVWADLYLSEAGADVMTQAEQPELTWYGRLNPSDLTQKTYCELWGCSFLRSAHGRLEQSIRECARLYLRRELGAALAWDVYYHATGRKPEPNAGAWRKPHETFFPIDDWTEDFDFPPDFDRWLAAFNCRSGVECEHDEQTTGKIARAVPDGTRAEVCDGNESRPANSSRG